MTKKEWQEYYGIDDEHMNLLEEVLRIFEGKIVSIEDIS